jgi:hypothetical protein
LQAQSDSHRSPREAIEHILKSRHPATVQQLAELATAETGIHEEEVVQIVKQMETEGSLILQEPLRDIRSTWDYLRTPVLSLWFWIALAATILTASVILLAPGSFPIVVIRWVSGSILLFFLPGYALLQLLFPDRKEKNSLERFVLSLGLSLAIVPLIGLILTYTPWSLNSIPVVLCIGAFSIGVLTVAVIRKGLHMRNRRPFV